MRARKATKRVTFAARAKVTKTAGGQREWPLPQVVRAKWAKLSTVSGCKCPDLPEVSVDGAAFL